MKLSPKSSVPAGTSTVFIKRLAAAIFLINLFAVALTYATLRHSRLQFEERAEITTQNLAQVLDQYIAGFINKIDLALLASVDEIEKQLAGGGIKPRELNEFLARQTARLPELDGLRMANAQGKIAYGPGVQANDPKSIADRHYFIRLRDDAKAGLHISRPVVSRIIGKRVVILSRRVNHPDGSFAGVIYGVIPLEHFLKVFTSIDVGKHGAITLRDGELSVLARYPELRAIDGNVNRKKVSGRFRELIRSGRRTGTYKTLTPVDETERTYTYRRISDYPLYITVGLATNDYLAEWRREVVIMSAVTALLFLVTLIASWRIWLNWKRNRAAVQALMQQEAKFRTIADYTYDWEFWLSPDRVFIHTSPSCLRITGYEADAFYDDPALLGRIVLPEDRELYTRHCREAEVRLGCENLVFRIRHADGTIRWLDHVCQPIVNESGDFLGTRGSNRDITERMTLEHAVNESEKKYRTLFEESKDVVFMVDVTGKIQDMNPAGTELLGYTNEEFRALNVADDFGIPAKVSEELMKKLTEAGFVKNFELEMRRKDGETVLVHFSATVMRDDTGKIIGYRGIARDVSERWRLEQQLMQAQKMESIGILAGGVAHDFNNLLTAISGYSQMIRDGITAEDDGILRESIEQVLKAASRAADLTRSLLAFSRKQVINLEPVSINGIIGNIGRLIERIIGEDIELSTSFNREDLLVLADVGQLEQVLMNLAANARDAMPHGGRLRISANTVVVPAGSESFYDVEKPGTYVHISVSDTGAGIDGKHLDRIFEPFFTTKEVGKGTGLGLAMIYGAIKQHNGSVLAESCPGRGTTFNIFLPVLENARQVQDGPTMAETPAFGGSETLLIAEDEEMVRMFLKKIFERVGYSVIVAGDGAEALEKFRENIKDITLIISDVIMPGKNGREILAEVRKMNPGIKVLFISGYMANVMHEKGILEEGMDFIAKPFVKEQLLRKVREVLDRA